ncbi:MAG: replication-associated recombination protein A, partial [Legionellales bacterium]|nr:replication-associated recombination protein A [Legionellales bacterium]
GPPGTGKTTLAKLIANSANALYLELSAVTSGVKDIREAVKQAQHAESLEQITILFVDEVHRFNKSQQDAFLPFIENGLLTFIGATTENPSFALNNALLSRVKLYVLKSLTDIELLQILNRAITYISSLKNITIEFPKEEQEVFIKTIDGDARAMLNNFELIAEYLQNNKTAIVTNKLIQKITSNNARKFDNRGDIFYQQISALHKSVRGSNPDAALYWFARMMDGGCDPRYIIRRVIRMASEDIGNADPRGLTIALDAANAYERLGSPEGDLAIAQAITYLAVAAKSNSTYIAYNEALADVKQYGSLDVPKHICNATTTMLSNLGYGVGYKYDHDFSNAHATGQAYFPEKIGKKIYYKPVNRGLEINIGKKLAELRKEKIS